jgi:uncharacterized protein
MRPGKSITFVVAVAVVGALLFAGLRGLGAAEGPLASTAGRVGTFTTVFLGIFIEAAPFLLLGTLASGLVEVYINKDQVARLIPRDPIRGAMVGSMLGFLFPVCECGVVPLTRRLFRKGLPMSAGVALLLAGPAFNPIVIASTAAAFGVGQILFLRLGLTVLIAVTVGLVFAAQRNSHQLLRPESMPPISGGSQGQGVLPAVSTAPAQRPAARPRLAQAMAIAADEFFEMGRFLIMGALLAALMQTIVPQAALLALGTGPVVSVITLIGLAIILSICSTVDSFIALSFAGTFSTGAILSFLVYGPMVDIKSTLMFLTVFRRRTVAYLVTLPLLLMLVIAVFINLNTSW